MHSGSGNHAAKYVLMIQMDKCIINAGCRLICMCVCFVYFIRAVEDAFVFYLLWINELPNNWGN